MKDVFKLPYFKHDFPKAIELRLALHSSNSSTENTTMLYKPMTECVINIIMDDNSNSVGSSYCSNCNQPIGLFNNYCSKCGAKVKSKCIIDKTN